MLQVGKAQHIQFDPLRAHPVSIPEGGVCVVANSLVEASKVRVGVCACTRECVGRVQRLQMGSVHARAWFVVGGVRVLGLCTFGRVPSGLERALRGLWEMRGGAGSTGKTTPHHVG